MFAYGVSVLRGTVSLVLLETVFGVEFGKFAHKRIALGLGDDGGCSNRSAFRIAFDDVHLTRVDMKRVPIHEHEVD